MNTYELESKLDALRRILYSASSSDVLVIGVLVVVALLVFMVTWRNWS